MSAAALRRLFGAPVNIRSAGLRVLAARAICALQPLLHPLVPVALVPVALVPVALVPVAHAQSCSRAEFEAVVDAASTTLTSINASNAPAFQAKLRQLKDKRGWTNEQLMREGEPFVRDQTIQSFDQAAMQLMAKINSADSGEADCAALTGLRQSLAALIETQTAKWAYMFAQIDKALAE
jgi:hypothetical protein